MKEILSIPFLLFFTITILCSIMLIWIYCLSSSNAAVIAKVFSVIITVSLMIMFMLVINFAVAKESDMKRAVEKAILAEKINGYRNLPTVPCWHGMLVEIVDDFEDTQEVLGCTCYIVRRINSYELGNWQENSIEDRQDKNNSHIVLGKIFIRTSYPVSYDKNKSEIFKYTEDGLLETTGKYI